MCLSKTEMIFVRVWCIRTPSLILASATNFPFQRRIPYVFWGGCENSIRCQFYQYIFLFGRIRSSFSAHARGPFSYALISWSNSFYLMIDDVVYFFILRSLAKIPSCMTQFSQRGFYLADRYRQERSVHWVFSLSPMGLWMAGGCTFQFTTSIFFVVRHIHLDVHAG